MDKNSKKHVLGTHVLHLHGSRAIASMFNVSRSTVARWKEAGAPIAQVGKSYQAQYEELWTWLKRENVF